MVLRTRDQSLPSSIGVVGGIKRARKTLPLDRGRDVDNI